MTNLVILCVALVAFLAYSEACRCQSQHPQTQFCNSQFVVQAKVLRRRTINRGRNVVYTVTILRDFKDDRRRYSTTQNIYTRSSSASCGSNFNLEKEYIISGSINGQKWNTDLCSWNTRTSSLSQYQRTALDRGIYKNSCSCKIVECSFGGSQCPQPTGGSCVIRSPADVNCWYQNNSCMMSTYGCAWHSPACA
ncbi:metalloproteinase inhibitor 3-like [Ostrea edulis]|uniref:metalloproteinase inhibitor 3-like n=1 Tax=Ostrea edulis TaxID=37623 RepID=UPI0024AF696E|nr:metalloproteinase inhibitor 3-like [Ostrea edulis]